MNVCLQKKDVVVDPPLCILNHLETKLSHHTILFARGWPIQMFRIISREKIILTIMMVDFYEGECDLYVLLALEVDVRPPRGPIHCKRYK